MKKIRLLLAAIAAMVTMGVNAQSWTAPTIQGEDPVSGTQYKVMNVGAGTFLDMGKAWFGWSTTAILSNNGIYFTLTADGDNWKFIRTGTQGVFTSGNGISGDAMHVDNTAHTYGISKLSNGYYHIHDASGNESSLCWGYGTPSGQSLAGVVAHADATAEGWNCDWDFVSVNSFEVYDARLNLYNEYLKSNALGINTDDAATVYNNTSATISELNAATTALKQSRRDYYISLATNDAPQDLTEFYVVNPDFSTFDATGWTRTGTWGNQQFGTGAMESWRNNNVSVLQDLSGLPNGRYRVSCDMISGNDTKTAYVYAKGMTEVEGEHVTAKSSQDNYATMSNEVAGNTISAYPVLVGDGKMTIGFKDPSGWVVVDNFKIIYYGPDLTALKEALQSQIDAVPALQGTTTTAAYNAAKNYADGIDMDALTTEEAISSASSELAALVATAESLQTPYAHYQNVKAAVVAISQSVNTTDADAAVDAATTNEAVDAATTALRNNLATYIASAEVTSPVDVTNAWIDNAAPGVAGNLNYWINSGNPTLESQLFEYWNVAAGTTKQVLATTLPAGYYILSAIAYTRTNMIATLNAGSNTMNIATVSSEVVNGRSAGSNWIAQGNGLNKLTFQLEEPTSNLEIGLTADNTTGDHWICWRSYKLEYLGTDPFAAYRIELAEAVAAAEDVEENSTTSAAYSALQTALSTYNKEWDNSEDWETAIEAIETATTTATTLQPSYATWAYMKNKVSAMTSVEGYTETVDGATTTLNSVISSADHAVEAATTTDVVDTQIATVKSAALTFLAGVRSDGAHPFDITFFITNPNFDNNNIDGWTRTYNGGSANTRCHSNEFYDNNSFDFYQTLTNMPKGNYELKVQAFQRPGWAVAAYNAYLNGNTSTDAVVYINDGETSVKHIASDAQNAPLYWLNNGDYPDDSKVGSEGAYKYIPNSMEGAEVWFAADHYDNSILTAVDGTLKLGFKADKKTADGTWTLFDNFRLYFYGQSINVAMSETEAFAALADIEGANVTMVRNTKVGFNTVALPFDLTAEQVEEFFGEDAEVYEYSDGGDDADNVEVDFGYKSEYTIEANVPVLVKATKAVSEITANNVTVKTGEAKVEGTYLDFVGNYSGQVKIAEGDWFIGKDAVYQSTGDTNIKGFRAYLKTKSAEVKGIQLFIEGVATSISEINGIEKAENGAIYTVSGQRVQKAQKGLYIVNGKKVVVK